MARKKCLVICTKYPYPPSYGLKIAVYQIINTLQEFFETYVVVITDEKKSSDFEAWASLKGIKYYIFNKNRIKMFLNSLQASFSTKPFQVSMYYFNDVEEYIMKLIQEEKIDLVVPVLVRTALYASKVKQMLSVPVLFAMVDRISTNYKRLIKNSYVNPLLRNIYRIEANRLERFEKDIVGIFDKTYLVNVDEIESFGKNDKLFALPNYVDKKLLEYEVKDHSYSNYVIFFGKMNYQPNVDAVLWFLKYVFPYVNSKIKFGIIGSNPAKKIIKESKKYGNRIKFFGFVDDPYVILRSAGAVIAPMRTGAGIQNKVLEAMAVESLVILSSLAANPIRGENGVHFFVEDDPKKFLDLINDIFSDNLKYENVRENARKFVKEKFSFEKNISIIREQLSQFINQV